MSLASSPAGQEAGAWPPRSQAGVRATRRRGRRACPPPRRRAAGRRPRRSTTGVGAGVGGSSTRSSLAGTSPRPRRRAARPPPLLAPVRERGVPGWFWWRGGRHSGSRTSAPRAAPTEAPSPARPRASSGALTASPRSTPAVSAAPAVSSSFTPTTAMLPPRAPVSAEDSSWVRPETHPSVLADAPWWALPSARWCATRGLQPAPLPLLTSTNPELCSRTGAGERGRAGCAPRWCSGGGRRRHAAQQRAPRGLLLLRLPEQDRGGGGLCWGTKGKGGRCVCGANWSERCTQMQPTPSSSTTSSATTQQTHRQGTVDETHVVEEKRNKNNQITCQAGEIHFGVTICSG